MSLAVEVADAVSASWRRRFLRPSAALGEEAITSDILLALEEDLSPFVRNVKSFTRAEEGGTQGAAIGADFELHFLGSGGARHLGYRVQAKLAKLEYRPPIYTYDFDYTTGRGVRQSDALIASARRASCIPMYFVYNSPSCVADLLGQPIYPFALRRWRSCRGCSHQHAIRIDAALTIATVPASMARRASIRSSRRLTNVTDVARFMAPWSCLLHQHPSAPKSSGAPGSDQLTIAGLRTQFLHQLDWLLSWPDVTADEMEALGSERVLVQEGLGERPVPDDVARLWRGQADFTLGDLARARRSADPGAVDGQGDASLGSMLIVELEE